MNRPENVWIKWYAGVTTTARASHRTRVVVRPDGKDRIATSPSVNKTVRTTAIVPRRTCVPVNVGGKVTIVRYQFVHRNATMVACVLPPIPANAINSTMRLRITVWQGVDLCSKISMVLPCGQDGPGMIVRFPFVFKPRSSSPMSLPRPHRGTKRTVGVVQTVSYSASLPPRVKPCRVVRCTTCTSPAMMDDRGKRVVDGIRTTRVVVFVAMAPPSLVTSVIPRFK